MMRKVGTLVILALSLGCVSDRTPEPEDEPEAESPIIEEAIPEPEPGVVEQAPIRKLGSSRWNPPADLPHLESTPPELRKQIDDLIAVLVDVSAGRECLDARQKLIAIGKPAFPRILGAMAGIRDNLTDDDTLEERIEESTLKLCDEALREMDGYLTAMEKSYLRPGTNTRYVQYICRLHYKRWMQVLKDMEELPGPFDPSKEW